MVELEYDDEMEDDGKVMHIVITLTDEDIEELQSGDGNVGMFETGYEKNLIPNVRSIFHIMKKEE